MSEQTKIEWCDSTINFWSGCTKVSPGCANCYAEAQSNRNMGNLGKWGKGAPRLLHESAFAAARRLNAKPLVCGECGTSWAISQLSHEGAICSAENCRGVLHRRRIFSLSMGDWLDPEVNVGWLLRMLHTIWECQDVTWILCTKRPELFKRRIEDALDVITDGTGSNAEFWQWLVNWIGGKPPQNIWLLASVENQPVANERVFELLKIPAICRGLSLEPLLAPVNLEAICTPGVCFSALASGLVIKEKIDWIIIGGESGNSARICAVDWICDLIRQGKENGTAVFVKQLGARPANFDLTRLTPSKTPKNGNPLEWPEDMRVRQFPKLLA